MGLRRASFVALAAVGCTKPNPAFDQDGDGGSTRAEGEAGNDDKDTSADSISSVDASADNGSVGETTVAGTDGVTSASDELGTTQNVEGSSGPVDCSISADYDWEIEVTENDVPAQFDCNVPFEAAGHVLMAADDLLVISNCSSCECAAPRGQLEFHAPGILPSDHFIVGDCARVVIEWSSETQCRPIGFVASSDNMLAIRVKVVAGQDVFTLPAAVGGDAIDIAPAELCDCTNCCENTGTSALGFKGISIAEGTSTDVPDLLTNGDVYFVDVLEAHIHVDCSHSLAWTAILEL